MPPPEADVERALASIARMRERRPSVLLTSHFGAVRDADEGFDRGASSASSSWAATVRAALEDEPAADGDHLESVLREQAREEYETDSGSPFDLGRYDAIGSIRMNADGLARYWRKRWEREAASLS